MALDYVQKLYRAEIKAVDPEKGTVEAIVSTETPDRDGDIIRAGNWDTANFMRHPVLLSSHNYRDLRGVLGEWVKLEVEGKKLIGTAQYFLNSGNEEADWGFELARRGLAAYSVGFSPDRERMRPREDGKGMEFRGQELLEVSQVVIPSNPKALQRMKGLDLHPAILELVEEIAKGDSKDGEDEHVLTDLARLEKLLEETNTRLYDLETFLYQQHRKDPPDPQSHEDDRQDIGEAIWGGREW